MDSGLAGDGEVGVFAAFEGERFAVGELQVLPGDGGDAGLAGLDDRRVGEVRKFVGGLGVLLLGVAFGGVLVLGVDHAAGDFVQGVQGGGLFIGRGLILPVGADTGGELDGAVGGSGLVECFGERVGLFEERHGGRHVAGGLGGGDGPGADDQALSGT